MKENLKFYRHNFIQTIGFIHMISEKMNRRRIMKNALCICAILITAASQAFAGSVTVARYARNTMFIEHRPVFSPDGSRIALQARDGKNLRGNSAHIWVGNSSRGNFRKMYSHPVNHITWISNNQIAFQDRSERSAVVVKSVTIDSGATSVMYRRVLRRSGYSTESVNIHKISNTGRYLLMNDRSGFFLQDISGNRRIDLSGFNYKYYRNNTGIAFSSDDTALLVKDDNNSGNTAYDLYAITGSGLQSRGKLDFTSILGARKSLTNNFHFDNSGNRIGFAIEYCRGGCSLLTYIYDINTRQTRYTGTIRGNQLLSVNWNNDLTKIIYNDFHQKLVVKDIQ